jgi:hypothetical protein
MSNTNIFIHEEYKNRLSSDTQQKWLNIIDDNKYFPVDIYEPYSITKCRKYVVYCVNVDTDSVDFNNLYRMRFDTHYKKTHDAIRFMIDVNLRSLEMSDVTSFYQQCSIRSTYFYGCGVMKRRDKSFKPFKLVEFGG